MEKIYFQMVMHFYLKNQLFQRFAEHLRQLILQHFVIMPPGVQPVTLARLNSVRDNKLMNKNRYVGVF